MDKKYISTRELAQMYGISEEVARRWCKKGRVKAVKIGKKWFIYE